ncbi:MAG: hypothetical protein L0241_17940 [Planctomycetia bacterium]|nr:hypothetical protein [Planctomycetia bacterium]
MSIQFSVSPFGRLVFYKVNGVPTPAEARAFLNEVLSHRNFRRGFAFLGESTSSDIPHAAFTTTLAREVLAQANRLAPCRWAVLVPSQTGQELVRRRAAQTEGSGVEVAPFLTMEDATNWLGSINEYPAERNYLEDREDAPSSLTPMGTP